MLDFILGNAVYAQNQKYRLKKVPSGVMEADVNAAYVPCSFVGHSEIKVSLSGF